MSKHTAGPWSVVEYEEVSDSRGDPIAWMAVRGKVGELDEPVEYQANARLTAASPDLLAAAKEIINWQREMAMESWPVREGAMTVEEYWGEDSSLIKLQAAIAKAEPPE